tara:strand:- start:1144 stop:1434 length:291 start_codon:yes stop_codon:yes gene_type:complete
MKKLTPHKNSRRLNDVIRDLYKGNGGKGNAWYFNDLRSQGRRKVFKSSAQEYSIWEKVLRDLHALGHTDWQMFSTRTMVSYLLAPMSGIKKYESSQ